MSCFFRFLTLSRSARDISMRLEGSCTFHCPADVSPRAVPSIFFGRAPRALLHQGLSVGSREVTENCLCFFVDPSFHRPASKVLFLQVNFNAIFLFFSFRSVRVCFCSSHRVYRSVAEQAPSGSCPTLFPLRGGGSEDCAGGLANFSPILHPGLLSRWPPSRRSQSFDRHALCTLQSSRPSRRPLFTSPPPRPLRFSSSLCWFPFRSARMFARRGEPFPSLRLSLTPYLFVPFVSTFFCRLLFSSSLLSGVLSFVFGALVRIVTASAVIPVCFLAFWRGHRRAKLGVCAVTSRADLRSMQSGVVFPAFATIIPRPQPSSLSVLSVLLGASSMLRPMRRASGPLGEAATTSPRSLFWRRNGDRVLRVLSSAALALPLRGCASPLQCFGSSSVLL